MPSQPLNQHIKQGAQAQHRQPQVQQNPVKSRTSQSSLGQRGSDFGFDRRLGQHRYDPDMQLIWNASIRESWDNFDHSQPLLLEQSWAYGQAMLGQGLGVQRAQVVVQGECMGQAQFITRRLLGYIGLASCSRGPVWREQLTPAQRAQSLKLLQQQLPIRPVRAALFSPSATVPGCCPADTGNLSQVITGDSSVLLDLRQSQSQLLANLEGKWRNRLRAAQRHTDLELFVGVDALRLSALLDREVQQRKAKGFHGLPMSFIESFVDSHLQAEQAYVLCEARRQDQPLAGMLFLRHGNCATYHLGWLAPIARQLNVHNLLLWQGMLHLRGLGLHWLDLGGVNSEDLGGISHFKLATGGQPITHPGTFF